MASDRTIQTREHLFATRIFHEYTEVRAQAPRLYAQIQWILLGRVNMPSLLKARHAGRRTHTGARNMMLRAELSLTKCTHKAGYKGGCEILRIARLSIGNLVAQDVWPDEDAKS